MQTLRTETGMSKETTLQDKMMAAIAEIDTDAGVDDVIDKLEKANEAGRRIWQEAQAEMDRLRAELAEAREEVAACKREHERLTLLVDIWKAEADTDDNAKLARELNIQNGNLQRELAREKQRAEDNGKLAHDLGIELVRLKTDREWIAGPARGGDGTAGTRNGVPWWHDGDQLEVIFERTCGPEVMLVTVHADGDAWMTINGTDDDPGYEFRDISWYRNIGPLPEAPEGNKP